MGDDEKDRGRPGRREADDERKKKESEDEMEE